MATDEILGRLRETFGGEPDVVSFSGKTEVLDGVRRVYLTPEADTVIEFPADARCVVASVDGVIDKVWVSRTQPLTLTSRRTEVAPGWLNGPISDLRFSAQVLAVDLGALLRPEPFYCLKSSTISRYCPPRLEGLIFRPGHMGPGPGEWGI